MREFVKPNVFASRCLGFAQCRWNAATIPVKFIKELKPYVNYITVCPEVEIGLGVPRQPIRIVSVKGERKLMQPATGKDVTEKMVTFAGSFLNSLKDIDGFILKNRSPSCGIKDVKVYPGSEHVAPITGKSAGFFGGKILEMFSDLAIEDEGRLNDFQLREDFLTKLFTLASFREVKKSNKMDDLIQFHRINELLLRAYDPDGLQKLDSIIADPEQKNVDATMNLYEEQLKQVLTHVSGCASNIDVLMYVFDKISEKLSQEEKDFFLETIEKYENGQIPLSTNLLILKSFIIRLKDDELMNQTFFEPYPENLADLSTLRKGHGLCPA